VHSRDYNFSGMLCHATPDTKHSRFSATSSHADHAWSLVINKLDSCCSVMAGAPDVLLHRLQSVLNAAVRLVFSARKFDHTTPLLYELHWLNVPERVRFRLCVLTYRCLKGTASHYLAETIRPVSSRGTCQHLRSAETSTLLVPSMRRSTLGDRSFQWLPHGRGTLYCNMFGTRLLFPSSAEN